MWSLLFLRSTWSPRPADAPLYGDLIKEFAYAWNQHGYPVPADYLNPDGQPTDIDSRRYQLVRGRGDGRSIPQAAMPERIEEPELPYTNQSCGQAAMCSPSSQQPRQQPQRCTLLTLNAHIGDVSTLSREGEPRSPTLKPARSKSPPC